ncbi:MAG: hypothetical protein KF809_11285 [Chloroflexi bacterium]|nr:hypothetical protein [Chloroflexota bacterium]
MVRTPPRPLPRAAIGLALAASVVIGGATPVAAAAVRIPGAPSCTVFPSTNVWNKRVDTLPVRADSATLTASIGLGAHLHPDFGSYSGYGIPWNIVKSSTKRSKVSFRWASESDRVKYPIPASPRIEGGSDKHMLMLDKDSCTLYELYRVRKVDGKWKADSGAVWKLRSNKLRPKGWTSADAAGLPILPGLVRYDEVKAGAIRHALRFTAPRTRTGFIYPARHQAGSSGSSTLPPMGLRVRLKASVDISGYPRDARILLTALKRYGMILADNGSPWYVTGAPDPRWDDDAMHTLHGIKGSDFEVVDTSQLRNG